MTEWPWRSPEATRRALADRIAARYGPDERPRRLREVAYRRLLCRLFLAQPDRWVVKGGAALLLRLDPNRTSNDIDLAYVDEAGEHAVALEALREAVAADLGDFFDFEVERGHVVDADHPLERAFAVPILARVGDTEFTRFAVDLAQPRERVDAEWIEVRTATAGLAAVDELPRIATLTFPAQLADKTCAMYERHGPRGAHSSRARDLADVAMIARQVDIEGDELQTRLRAEERRRLDAGTLIAPLPGALELSEAQRDDWARRWRTATRDAPVTFADALDLAGTLLDPVLAGGVEGARWIASSARWTRR